MITWLWPAPKGYRSTFGPAQVNTLRRMVARHYAAPHRFCCVTNVPGAYDADVEVVPDRQDFATLHNPHGRNNPSCYRRLWMFAPEARAVFGERFVSLDLDCVVTGDLASLWNRREDFVAWGDTNPLKGSHYNGSMLLMTAGARPKVWTDFHPLRSPALAKKAGCFGSDQGWISYCLGPREAKWTKADGVYSYRVHLASATGLPANAKIVFFHGHHDPWDADVRRQHPWVREYYQ